MANVMSSSIVLPADFIPRPDWLTVPDIQMERARRIITRDFWQSDNPFTEPVYQEIGFPFVVGRLMASSIADIYHSSAYVAAEKASVQYKKSFEGHCAQYKRQHKMRPRFLSQIFQQIITCDFFIYNQRNLAWAFDVDIAKLNEGDIHRPNKQPYQYHIDGLAADCDFNSHLIMEMARNFRKGEHNSKPDCRGIRRLYVVADCLATEFEHHMPFEPCDIVHFIAEPHRSPKMVESGVRVFIRGYVLEG